MPEASVSVDVVDIVIRIISNLGFPIFVAVYMMIRMERTLNALRDAIIELREESKTSVNMMMRYIGDHVEGTDADFDR